MRFSSEKKIAAGELMSDNLRMNFLTGSENNLLDSAVGVAVDSRNGV